MIADLLLLAPLACLKIIYVHNLDCNGVHISIVKGVKSTLGSCALGLSASQYFLSIVDPLPAIADIRVYALPYMTDEAGGPVRHCPRQPILLTLSGVL